jgi:hypothetical protein
MSGDFAKDVDRGKDVDRFKDVDRAKDVDRSKDVDRGPHSDDPVNDVFRCVSGLGGLLVVAFVAPVPAGGGGVRNGSGPRGLALSALARKAEDRENESAQRRQQTDEQLIASFVTSLQSRLKRD